MQTRQDHTRPQQITNTYVTHDCNFLTTHNKNGLEKETYEHYVKSKFDVYDSVVKCNICNIKTASDENYPRVTWSLNNQTNDSKLNETYLTDDKFNLTLNIKPGDYHSLWETLNELKQKLHEYNVGRLYLEKPNFANSLLKFSDVNRMLHYVFKDTQINIFIFHNDNQQLKVDSETRESVIVHAESEVEDNLHQKVTPIVTESRFDAKIHNDATQVLKLTLSKDYKIDPYTKIVVKLKVNKNIADDISLQSVNNDKFLIKRGLICNISNDYKTGTLESRNHNALKLFKGTTVAYLENVMYHEPLLLINQIIETERPTEKTRIKKLNLITT